MEIFSLFLPVAIQYQMKAFNGKAPITRNLTPVFLRCRERRAARRFGGGPTGDADRLLDVEGGHKEVSLEMTSLPPQWVEAAEQARDDIKLIKDKLAQLEKAQSKRLLVMISDSSFSFGHLLFLGIVSLPRAVSHSFGREHGRPCCNGGHNVGCYPYPSKITTSPPMAYGYLFCWLFQF